MTFAKHASALVDSEHYIAIVAEEEQAACEKVAALSPLVASETEMRIALAVWEKARTRITHLQEWLSEHVKNIEAFERYSRQTGPDPAVNLAD